MDYWRECIESAFEDARLSASSEQIATVAAVVRGAQECYGMAFPAPESPYPREIAELKRELEMEREKVLCGQCRGTGKIVTHGPVHSTTSPCWQCNGRGRYNP